MHCPKYGGTSVGNPERIKNAARLAKYRAKGDQMRSVSAMSGDDNPSLAKRKSCLAQ